MRSGGQEGNLMDEEGVGKALGTGPICFPHCPAHASTNSYIQ